MSALARYSFLRGEHGANVRGGSPIIYKLRILSSNVLIVVLFPDCLVTNSHSDLTEQELKSSMTYWSQLGHYSLRSELGKISDSIASIDRGGLCLVVVAIADSGDRGCRGCSTGAVRTSPSPMQWWRRRRRCVRAPPWASEGRSTCGPGRSVRPPDHRARIRCNSNARPPPSNTRECGCGSGGSGWRRFSTRRRRNAFG